MSCGCIAKKRTSKQDCISNLARKAAILEKCVYVVYQKKDGTYGFDKLGQDIKGIIVEYRHYL